MCVLPDPVSELNMDVREIVRAGVPGWAEAERAGVGHSTAAHSLMDLCAL